MPAGGDIFFVQTSQVLLVDRHARDIADVRRLVSALPHVTMAIRAQKTGVSLVKPVMDVNPLHCLATIRMHAQMTVAVRSPDVSTILTTATMAINAQWTLAI